MTLLMSPSSVKMTAESDLLKQCLEFGQALDAKGRTFSLKVNVGTFSFSLESREITHEVLDKKKTRKKLSPSQIRRNQRRKENFLKKKANSPVDKPETVPEKEQEEGKTHKCDLCDKDFKSEKGLKTHKARTHKTEGLRSLNQGSSPLKLSPEKEDFREEQCACCREVMSPNHQCSEEDSEEDDEEEEEEEEEEDQPSSCSARGCGRPLPCDWIHW